MSVTVNSFEGNFKDKIFKFNNTYLVLVNDTFDVKSMMGGKITAYSDYLNISMLQIQNQLLVHHDKKFFSIKQKE